MSTEPPDDGFPSPDDATTHIAYSVAPPYFNLGARFSHGPITPKASPGPVVGDLIARLSKLYSALQHGGSNLARAVEAEPYYLTRLAHRASVDILFERSGDERDSIAPPSEGDAWRSLMGLDHLSGVAIDHVVAVAANYGGAVSTAYRQLASLVADQSIDVDFFVAQNGRPLRSSFRHLPHGRAADHAIALGSREVVRVHTAALTGDLDELAGRKGTFKLLRPVGAPQGQDRAWREAVGGRRSVEGALSDEASTDIRRLGAWRARITAEIELTHMTAPTTTSSEAIEGVMLRVMSVQPELGPVEAE